MNDIDKGSFKKGVRIVPREKSLNPPFGGER